MSSPLFFYKLYRETKELKSEKSQNPEAIFARSSGAIDKNGTWLYEQIS